MPTDCQPGKISNASKAECVNCEAGKHAKDNGCVTCVQGWVALTPGLPECRECREKYYCPTPVEELSCFANELREFYLIYAPEKTLDAQADYDFYIVNGGNATSDDTGKEQLDELRRRRRALEIEADIAGVPEAWRAPEVAQTP